MPSFPFAHPSPMNPVKRLIRQRRAQPNHIGPIGPWSSGKATISGAVDQAGGQPLFKQQDATFAAAGKIALWTKADSVTAFDTLEIIPFD
jgi:hypothetical protein